MTLFENEAHDANIYSSNTGEIQHLLRSLVIRTTVQPLLRLTSTCRAVRPRYTCKVLHSETIGDAILAWLKPVYHRVPPTLPVLAIPRHSMYGLHPWKLTWNLKITQLKRKSSSKPPFLGSMLIFRGVFTIPWKVEKMGSQSKGL